MIRKVFLVFQITKFEIPPGTPAGGGIGLAMPSKSKVLHVSIDKTVIMIHMLINTMNPLIERRFVIFGDGMQIGAGPDGRTVDQLDHAGTITVNLQNGGVLVIHVFDGGEVALAD